MKRYGFIRTQEDIKFLILYSLKFIKFPIDFDNIIDICTWCDDGFNYFDLNEAFLDLVSSGHIEQVQENNYIITEKGVQTSQEFEGRLPMSVKEIANISALRVTKQIKRNAHIKAHTLEISEVDYVVKLSMEDVFSIDFNVATKTQAALIEKQFKENAEKIYDDLLQILTKEYSN